ncbi:MAG: DUF2505 domain-containing protein [Actinomycetota bacterium]|nr:DUF2505 domain-containing protein [Actinomycetota bacterium]
MDTMLIRHQLRYDAAPDQVYEMLADPAFRNRVCETMRTVSHDVAVDLDGDKTTVRIDMLQRTQGMPGFARKVVGDQTRVIQSELWTARRSADLKVEIPGKPGHISGKITLAAEESGTVESFAGQARINIPLLGGKLESLIEKLFVAGMDTEQRVGAEWLAGRRS